MGDGGGHSTTLAAYSLVSLSEASGSNSEWRSIALSTKRVSTGEVTQRHGQHERAASGRRGALAWHDKEEWDEAAGWRESWPPPEGPNEPNAMG